MQNGQSVSETKNVTQLVGVIDNKSTTDELRTCEHFFVDSEMENRRHRVVNFAMNILDGHTLTQKLVRVIDKLKCAAKLNVSFGFVLKNVEDGTCRYYYAHENKHFDGMFKVCVDQRRFGENQEFFEKQ